MGGRQEGGQEWKRKEKKKRLWRRRKKGQVEESCSLGSLKAAGPGRELDPI